MHQRFFISALTLNKTIHPHMITKVPHDMRPHAAQEPGKGYTNTIYMVSDFNTQEKRWPSSEHLHT